MHFRISQPILLFLINNIAISNCELNGLSAQNSLNLNGTSDFQNPSITTETRDDPASASAVVSMDKLIDIEPGELAKLSVGTVITGVSKSIIDGSQPIRNSVYNVDPDDKSNGNSSKLQLRVGMPAQDLTDQLIEEMDWAVTSYDNTSNTQTATEDSSASNPIQYISPNMGVVTVFLGFTILFFLLATIAYAADRRVVQSRNLDL